MITKISPQQISNELFKLVGKNYLFLDKTKVTLDAQESIVGKEFFKNGNNETPTWEEVENTAVVFITDSETNAIITEARLIRFNKDNNEIVVVADATDSDLLARLEAHINDKNNPHEVTTIQLGLENVDNTSDLDKPISTATQDALDEITTAATELEARVETNELHIAENTSAIAANEVGINTNATAIVNLSTKEQQDV